MPYNQDDQEEGRKVPAAPPLTEAQINELAERYSIPPLDVLRIQRRTGTWCGFDDMHEFLYFCSKKNLDPMLPGEVHAEPRYNKRAGRYMCTIIMHIDGARKLADLTKQYDGQDAPVFKYSAQNKLESATIRIYRKDCAHPFEATAHLVEYQAGGLWGTKPHVMVAKVAEMLVFRKAFPAAMAGVYIPEEFEREERVERGEIVDQPDKVEDFTVGRKAAAPATTQISPSNEGEKQEAKPEPAKQAEPADREHPAAAGLKAIKQKLGADTDTPAVTKAVNTFFGHFLNVTALPKDIGSYVAPIAVLEYLVKTDDGCKAFLLDPEKAGTIMRQPLIDVVKKMGWEPEVETKAREFIRKKGWTDKEFFDWIDVTGANKLDSADVTSFLELATATPKAYMILEIKRQEPVSDLITKLSKNFGGMAGIGRAAPTVVADAIRKLGGGGE